MRYPSRRYRHLLHRLEQRALRPWRRAVYLVGEQQVGEHWPRFKAGLEAVACLPVEHSRAGDIGGGEIRRELNAILRQADRSCESASYGGLAKPWDSL